MQPDFSWVLSGEFDAPQDPDRLHTLAGIARETYDKGYVAIDNDDLTLVSLTLGWARKVTANVGFHKQGKDIHDLNHVSLSVEGLNDGLRILAVDYNPLRPGEVPEIAVTHSTSSDQERFSLGEDFHANTLRFAVAKFASQVFFRANL